MKNKNKEKKVEEFTEKHRPKIIRLEVKRLEAATEGSVVAGSCFYAKHACIAGWRFVSIGRRSDIRRRGLAASGADYVILPKELRSEVTLQAAALRDAEVVVSGAMWRSTRIAVEDKLRGAGVRFHSLAGDGAIVLKPKTLTQFRTPY